MKTLKKFTTDQYHTMISSGILTSEDRVQLLEGDVVEISPQGKRHQACVDRLASLLCGKLNPNDANIRIQGPVVLSDLSEPEPDLSILHPRQDFYESAHPTPQDIYLIIEVGETSSEFDREIKLPLYAKAGIREVWLVDLERQEIGVYRSPAGENYGDFSVMKGEEEFRPAAFPEVKFMAGEILG